MATKKSVWVLFGILVISAWVLGSAIQAGAETMNFKLYALIGTEAATRSAISSRSPWTMAAIIV